MISPDLLTMLRCPQTGQTLAVATPDLLSRINETRMSSSASNEGLPNSSKLTMTESITAALVRADGKVLYPIRDGIPVLLPDEAIPCDPVAPV